MAKGGNKLKKIKSVVLKKMQSFKIGRPVPDSAEANPCSDGDDYSQDMHEVYVGRSRRRYLLSKNIVDHPLFRELAQRTGESEDSITVACEVVLFEHMIWMLQHVDESQRESLDELVQFYAY